MYFNWNSPLTAFDRMSVIFRVIQNTARSDALIFWGNQQGFYQANGDARGGAHFGFQSGDNLNNRTNWGGYDDIIMRRIFKHNDDTAPTGGTFTLSYLGQTTTAISYNASAATILAALEALSNIAPGDITVTGGPLPNTAVVITWTFAAGYGNGFITMNGASLTGGSGPSGGLRNEGGATARGSIPTLPYPAGTPVSPYYDWVTGEDYLLEVYRSPKQNWTAAELTTDAEHPANNQHANEVAWRHDIVRLSTGVRTHIRDLLYPQGKATAGMSPSSSWGEQFPMPATPAWEVRWAEYRVDRQLVTSAVANYGSGFTDTDLRVDKVGFNMKSRTPRVTANNATLTQPGVVMRSRSMHSLGNQTDSNTITITTPPGTLTGEKILAFITADASAAISASDVNWKQIFEGRPTSGGAHLYVFEMAHAGAASYSFTQTFTNQAFAGILLTYFNADKFAKTLFGTPAFTADGTTNWTAPALQKPTNYGQVGVVVCTRPVGGGATITFPGNGMVERADTTDLTMAWINLGVAEEGSRSPAGLSLQKSGTMDLGIPYAVQFMVYPVLQRVMPTGTVSAGTWTGTTTPIHTNIDEATPSTADIITGPNGAVARFDLGDFAEDPNTGVGHGVRIWYRRQNAASASLLVEVYQGQTLIAQRTISIPAGDGYIEEFLPFTEAEADAITSYPALQAQLTSTTT